MKYKLFVLTILASVGFFNYHGMLPPNIIKMIFYLDVILCLIWALRDGVSLRDVDYPRTALVILLGSICISCIPASAFHSQSIVMSVMTTLPFIFAYGYFWILMKLNIPRKKILNTYIVLCVLSTIVYFCNVATMPHNIFGEPILSEDLTRGIIRLPVVFNEMYPLLVFYSINQWLLTKEKKWLVVLAWCIVMVFMCVTRQIIASTLVLGAWFFFRRISTAKKVLMAVVAICIVVFILPMIPMYKTMIELSEDQRDSNAETEDIRITAWRYYTYENQTNAVTPLIGNGVPSFGNSLWGRMVDTETEVNGCFAADVGWAGFFWYFGIFATGALIYIMARAILKRKPQDQQYLTYWVIYIAITSIASGPVVYYNWIMSISVVLYLIFKKDGDETQDSDTTETSNDEKDESNTERASILPKYPQIR